MAAKVDATLTSGDGDAGINLISAAAGFPEPAAPSLMVPPIVQRGPVRRQGRKPTGLAKVGVTQEGVHLYDLRGTSCRWPLGTFLAHTEHFCGAPSVPGCPYCPEHSARAFARVGLRRAISKPLVRT
jgi:GcrA cell cycle regulator